MSSSSGQQRSAAEGLRRMQEDPDIRGEALAAATAVPQGGTRGAARAYHSSVCMKLSCIPSLSVECFPMSANIMLLDPGTRNTYQNAMAKQAAGVNASNYQAHERTYSTVRRKITGPRVFLKC